MDAHRFAFVSLIAALTASWGCRPTPGIRDTVDSSGFPLRIEVSAEEEAAADPALLTARMDAYRKTKGARRGARAAAMSRAPAAGVAAAEAADEFDPFVERDCPPEGSAKSPRKAQANRLKNRIQVPDASDFDTAVTLEALRQPGEDTERWSTALAATIEGYVRSAKGTSKETCNCGAKDKHLTDTHLDIVAGPDDEGRPVIAEITPVWRLIHEHFGMEDWSSPAIKQKYEGHRVRITGWLFFDEAHLHDADNTDPGDWTGNENWRATCWEIHPITSIELAE
jgi:hypothetical protein